LPAPRRAPAPPISVEQRYGIDPGAAIRMSEILQACAAPGRPGTIDVSKLEKSERRAAGALCYAYDSGWLRGYREAKAE